MSVWQGAGGAAAVSGLGEREQRWQTGPFGDIPVSVDTAIPCDKRQRARGGGAVVTKQCSATGCRATDNNRAFVEIYLGNMFTPGKLPVRPVTSSRGPSPFFMTIRQTIPPSILLKTGICSLCVLQTDFFMFRLNHYHCPRSLFSLNLSLLIQMQTTRNGQCKGNAWNPKNAFFDQRQRPTLIHQSNVFARRRCLHVTQQPAVG